MKLSLDGLSKGTFRSEDWFGAIERGEIQLTDETLKELIAAYLARGKKLKLHSIVAELQREPFGPAANEQRTRIQLSGWVTDRRSSDELPAATIAEEAISPHDRLLVTGPVVFLFAALILVAQMLSWNWTETQGADAPEDQAVTSTEDAAGSDALSASSDAGEGSSPSEESESSIDLSLIHI